MAMNIVDRIDNLVGVRHLLVSVSDKSGLDTFVPQLVALNPDLKIFSTGGTFSRLQEILGDAAGSHLTRVSDYTGQPVPKMKGADRAESFLLFYETVVWSYRNYRFNSTYYYVLFYFSFY